MSFASRVLSHRSMRPRNHLALVLSGLFLIWAVLWGMASYTLNKTVDQWVEASKAKNIAFSFSDRSTDGTPLTVHVHLDQMHVKFPTGAHEIKASEAVLYLSLWDWGTVSTKLRGTIEGSIGGLPFKADTFKIGFSEPENPPINEMEAGFSVWVQSLGLVFSPEKELPFGNKLDQLSFDVRVMGGPPDFTKSKKIQEWNDASGVLEFDQLDLLWGPLALSAKGTVGLNNALQPEGAFSGKVEGLDLAINKLVTNGTIDPRQETLLRSSISVLARPSGMMSGAAPIVPISIQGGGLYLGPVKIMSISPITWPE